MQLPNDNNTLCSFIGFLIYAIIAPTASSTKNALVATAPAVGTRSSFPFYGFRILATFAQIPTLDGKICRMSAKLDAVHSGADRQRFVQITEGWGKG